MIKHHNKLGQPIGHPMDNWQPCPTPSPIEMSGSFCQLQPLNCAKHAEDLYSHFQLDSENKIWTYLPYGPFKDFSEFSNWLTQKSQSQDPLFFAIIDKNSGRALGVASFLRMVENNGVIEVGHINYSPKLQKTPAATEAMYLMMQYAFEELGYRRYEWKCDSLNNGSRNAATRLGFTFEGIFRQALIYKGRNRDTAWYSITDQEWPALKTAFESWLASSNFNEQGVQIKSLGEIQKQR